MKIVVALGGNALLRRGEPAEADLQRQRVELAADAIAGFARDHDVVVTHGNGPQVGLLALQSEAYDAVRPYPLDVLGAETEGMIGYLLGQELHNRLPGRDVATVLTQVVVDGADRAFDHPTKPVGPAYDRETAERLARERGWQVRADGEVFRRVVPSPEPVDIVELASIELLVAARTLTICVGGGGIPVTRTRAGRLRGTEGVIDKDLASALLATRLGADMLVLLTDVDSVYRDWGTAAAAPIRHVTPRSLRALEFEAGSMGPKVEAACRFAERTGGIAAIGSLDEADAVVRGESGTLVARVQPPFAAAA